jgi:hypothetical protein
MARKAYVKLQPCFAASWKSLPAEIQLKILIEVLTFDRPIDSRTFGFQVMANLLPLLATPEFSEIAKEAVYAANTFKFSLFYVPKTQQGIRLFYPRALYNNFIRRIEIFTDNGEGKWSRLSRLMDGTLGLSRLSDLALRIHWYPSTGLESDDKALSELCKWDTVTISAQNVTVSVTTLDSTWDIQSLRNVLFSKISFASKAMVVSSEEKSTTVGGTIHMGYVVVEL